MTFTLPEELPATVTELDALLDAARASINVIQARRTAGEELTRDDVTDLRSLLEAVDVLTASRAEVAAADQAHTAEVNALLERAAAATAEPEPAAEQMTPDPVEDAAEAVPEPEVTPVAEPEVAPAVEPVSEPVAAAAAPVTFAGIGAHTPPEGGAEPGWEMDPSCPGYRPGMGRVGFAELGTAIDSVMPGSRSRNRPNKPSSTVGYAAQVVARLPRDCQMVGDSHALVAAIRTATDERSLPGGSLIRSLTAAAADPTGYVGGWCAPSEQLYTFCDVPNASDLISLPEITINRGGIRWPVEPDLSDIFNEFEWFFTETQLEAVGSGGEPVAQKTCVSIPCPDEFEEIRLSAVGYCVEAGILQTQGWPELITWFMQSLTQEHLRALSRRTVLDMVSGSTAKTIDPDTQIGTVSSILNSVALQATNLRLNRGLARAATIEGVAPSWLAEVMRADLAMREGVDTVSVTDSAVVGWFADRNIALQFIGDWQTRSAGEPGHLDTVAWPATVDVLLYPAGTWFRSMSNVIELGVMYPKAELQVNRYTRFFTEDAIAVGKRCNQSIVVTVPICVSGAVGDRQSVVCAAGS